MLVFFFCYSSRTLAAPPANSQIRLDSVKETSQRLAAGARLPEHAAVLVCCYSPMMTRVYERLMKRGL